MTRFLIALLKYVRDGFKVFLVPVSTIRDAAAHEHSVAKLIVLHIALVAMTLFCVRLRYPWAMYQDIADGNVDSLTSAQKLDHLSTITSQTNFASEAGLVAIELFAFFVFSILLSLVCKFVFSGAGSFRVLVGANMVLEAAIMAAMASAALLHIAFAVTGPQDPASTGATVLRLLGVLGPIAVGVLLISYTVLVARYGGGLSFPKAFGATLVYVGVLVALQLGSLVAAFTLTGMSFSEMPIHSWFFGSKAS